MLKLPSSIIVCEPLTTIPPPLLRGVGQVIVPQARLELYLTELVYDLLRIDYPLCRQILRGNNTREVFATAVRLAMPGIELAKRRAAGALTLR